jgi:SpoIID/LytB domain protein
MRRSTLIVTASLLVVALTTTIAGASGPGTTVPGATDDPFTGSPAHARERSAARGGFTFYGSGFGHGLGMSQWGSYGLARRGWDHRRILRNFYRGTKVQAAPNPVRTLRVGLTYDRTIIHLGARAGAVRLSVGRPNGNPVGRIPGGQTWSVRATRTGYAVRDASGSLVGGKTWGGASFDLFATYAGGARAFVPEADAVSGVGYAYNRGHLEFNLYRAGGGWRTRLILPIALEQYLYGIGEMPSSWPAQALQTQAVASRTFATYTARTFGLRSYCNCDITDGANDQVYAGFTKEGGTDGRRWVRAVDATRGRIVTYRGRVIQAFFAASDGGHSDSVEDVWHGGNPAFAIPYLKAECDPGEYTSANPWKHWRRSLTANELTARLAPYTGGIGTVTGFPAISRGAGGRIITATVMGRSGRASITGAELRAAISAWDGRIWINQNLNITAPIRSTYDALGCSPGLPTSPVRSVRGGASQSFRIGGIYRSNRAGITVWLRGAIDREYRAVGGPAGILGLPATQVGAVTGPVGATVGTRVGFKRGRILMRSRGAAHALWGPVLREYLRRGGATGPLGFPTSRVHADGAAGKTASFDHGTIVCRSGTCSLV